MTVTSVSSSLSSGVTETLTLTSLTSDDVIRESSDVMTLSQTPGAPVSRVVTSQTESVIITTGPGNVATMSPSEDLIKPDHVIISESVETFPELLSLDLARHQAEATTEEQISSKDTNSENNPNITLTSQEETFISEIELDENFNENVPTEHEAATELPQDIDSAEQTTVLFEDEESETDERPLMSGSSYEADLNRTDHGEPGEKDLEINETTEIPLTMKSEAVGQPGEKINIDNDVRPDIIDSKENKTESRQVHAKPTESDVVSVEITETSSENEIEPGTIIAMAPVTLMDNNVPSPSQSDQASDGSSQNNVIVPRAETQLQENLILDWISEEDEVSNLTSEISTEKPMSSVTQIQGTDLLVNLTTPVSLKVKDNPEVRIMLDEKEASNSNEFLKKTLFHVYT